MKTFWWTKKNILQIARILKVINKFCKYRYAKNITDATSKYKCSEWLFFVIVDVGCHGSTDAHKGLFPEENLVNIVGVAQVLVVIVVVGLGFRHHLTLPHYDADYHDDNRSHHQNHRHNQDYVRRVACWWGCHLQDKERGFMKMQIYRIKN